MEVCFGCGTGRRCGAPPLCPGCGERPIEVVWQRGETWKSSPSAELFLSVIASCFLLAHAALYVFLLTSLVRSASGSLFAAAALPVATMLGCQLVRWVVRSLFDLWGKTWTYCSADGTRWGSVCMLFGWYVAGEGGCLTSLQPTRPGSTLLCSSDAIGAGLRAVAANLSRLTGAKERDAFTPFDALMLTTFAGLVARGDATICRATAVGWRKDWLRRPQRSEPQTSFTIERANDCEEDGVIEREILETFQAKTSLVEPRAEPLRAAGYREAPRRPAPVRLRVEEVLRAPTLKSAAKALRTASHGGAPVAVAAAILEFARTDPARMAHLRLLLSEHRHLGRQA